MSETFRLNEDFDLMSCTSCGIRYLVPTDWRRDKQHNRGSGSCPNGHAWQYTTSEADKLRAERDRLKQNEAYLNDRVRELVDARDRETRRVTAAKGQITKLKKRASNGVCPCCNRTFADLARHMAGKHPGFVAEPDATAHVN